MTYPCDHSVTNKNREFWMLYPSSVNAKYFFLLLYCKNSAGPRTTYQPSTPIFQPIHLKKIIGSQWRSWLILQLNLAFLFDGRFASPSQGYRYVSQVIWNSIDTW